MWNTQLPCDVFSTPNPPPTPFLLSVSCWVFWSLKDLSDCTYDYYGMPLEVGGGTRLHSNHGRLWGVVDGGTGRDCSRGRGELTIMVCTSQGNYAEWGRGDWSVWMGILWDVCPLILLCVYVYARGVCERKRRRRRAHTLPQNTEIYLNCMYTANLSKKGLPHITW